MSTRPGHNQRTCPQCTKFLARKELYVVYDRLRGRIAHVDNPWPLLEDDERHELLAKIVRRSQQ